MSLFELGNLTEDDRLVLARTEDLVRGCRGGGPRFSAFLDSRQQVLAQTVAEKSGMNWTLDGGYPEAERKMLGIAQDFVPEKLPFVSLTVSGYEPFGHRDLLGALMHLGIARETLGDLVTDGDRSAVVFATLPASRIILQELVRVGRASVSVSEGGVPAPSDDGQEMTGTLASLRADAVLSLGLRISREKAADLIRSGRMERNHAPCLSVSQPIGEGDVLSLRGSGRIRVVSVNGESRKGRTFVTLRVYGRG